LSHHIGRCDAPCAFLTTQEEYRALVDEAMLFLKGKRKELLTTLEGEMRLAAQERRFETAAEIRDRLSHLRAVQERQRVDLGTEDQPKDLIAAARMGKVASLVVMEIRDGYLADRKQFEVKAPLEQDEGSLLEEFLGRYYHDRDAADMPREILITHALPEPETTLAFLREKRGGAVDLDVPQRGEKRRQLDLSLENAKVQLTEYLAKRERKNRQNFMVEALQEDLGLENPPKRIEGFDISHLSGTGTVASMVVFVEGKPSKKDYRKFNVKTVEGIDDFASMREVVGRRLRRLREEGGDGPDLILIDGGKGQLGAAMEALREHGFSDQPILGLAKRLEEIFLPGQSDALMLPKTSAALRLLQQVRDEAHRFAITFQRSKRKAYLEDSWISRIPGIGEKTRMKLLREFKTLEGVKSAEEKALVAVVGKAAAIKIRMAVNEGAE
jgi:excinuclease ABC subunit C